MRTSLVRTSTSTRSRFPFAGSAAKSAILLFVLGTSVAAHADASAQPSAADIALARSLGSEGVQLANAGNCQAALDKLQRAEALYHAPTILGRIGECQVTLGKLVLGTETLQRVVREQLPPNAPAAFSAAQTRAKKVLDGALPRIPKLKIHVDVAAGQTNLAVTLDGQAIPTATLDEDRPVDPGSHHVEAAAPGFRTATADVALKEGTQASVELRLDPDPNAAAASVAPMGPPPGAIPAPAPGPYPGALPGQGAGPAPMGMAAAPPAGVAPAPGAPGPYGPPGAMGPAPAPAPSKGGGAKTAGYVLLGVGGAGIVVGAVTGLLAIGKKSSLDGECPVKSSCPPDAQGNIDSMKSLATVSTIGFAAGAVGAIAGFILVNTGRSSEKAASHGERAASLEVHPWIGWASAGIGGRFE